ncbi:MAG: Hpt domain-containing protein, partial [Variovorax sp.]
MIGKHRQRAQVHRASGAPRSEIKKGGGGRPGGHSRWAVPGGLCTRPEQERTTPAPPPLLFVSVVARQRENFFDESLEGLASMESALLSLDDGGDTELVHGIFRAAHSIKGGAATFGFPEMAA